MDKVIYLSRKLKAFTFEEIFSLAEIKKNELNEYLDNLLADKILNKTSTGYVYVCNKKEIVQKIIKRNKKSARIKLNSNIKFDSNKSALLKAIDKIELPRIMTDEEKRIWKYAPSDKKKQAKIYLHLIKITKGLYGNDLKDFLKIYGTMHPEYALSATTIERKRKIYYLKGKVGLLGDGIKYSAKKEKTLLYYELFKKLYLNRLRYSQTKCISEIAKYFEINVSDLPHEKTFRNRLKKEFTKEEIKQLRS